MKLGEEKVVTLSEVEFIDRSFRSLLQGNGLRGDFEPTPSSTPLHLAPPFHRNTKNGGEKCLHWPGKKLKVNTFKERFS